MDMVSSNLLTKKKSFVILESDFEKGRKMAVPIPKKHKRIGEKLIVFREEFKGNMYCNIRKTYTKNGEEFVGKGLALSDDDMSDFLSNAEEVREFFDL